LRSNKSIVIAPANTGNDNRRSQAVIKTDQTNKGNLSKVSPRHLILKTVQIKLIAPAIEEIPAKCKLKIAKSTAGPEWVIAPDNGG
jgi:hypothetical protein